MDQPAKEHERDLDKGQPPCIRCRGGLYPCLCRHDVKRNATCLKET